MSLALFDFECPKHGVFEEFADRNFWFVPCPKCGKKSKKLISIGRINLANEDATHIRESADALLDRETARFSDKPHVRALAESPTRSNLKAYLKAEGLRYAENEKGAPPTYKRKPDPDRKQIVNSIMEMRRKRNRLEVRTHE